MLLGVENFQAAVGFKQMGLQSSFKCSGRLNVLNFMREGISYRKIETHKKLAYLNIWQYKMCKFSG